MVAGKPTALKRTKKCCRLKRVVESKFLGVILNENLSCREHVDYACKKVSKGLGILSHVRELVPTKALLHIYSSIVQPYFDYCSSAWDSCGKSLCVLIILSCI